MLLTTWKWAAKDEQLGRIPSQISHWLYCYWYYLSLIIWSTTINTFWICVNKHENGLKSRLDMKDNKKCITISLSTLTWNHCFVDIEGNSGSVHYIRWQSNLSYASYKVFDWTHDKFDVSNRLSNFKSKQYFAPNKNCYTTIRSSLLS